MKLKHDKVCKISATAKFHKKISYFRLSMRISISKGYLRRLYPQKQLNHPHYFSSTVTDLGIPNCSFLEIKFHEREMKVPCSQVSQSFRSKNDCQDQLIILTLQVKKPRLLEIKWHAWRHSVAQGTGSDQVSMLTTLSPEYSFSNMQSPCFGGFHTEWGLKQVMLSLGHAVMHMSVNKCRLTWPICTAKELTMAKCKKAVQ